MCVRIPTRSCECKPQQITKDRRVAKESHQCVCAYSDEQHRKLHTWTAMHLWKGRRIATKHCLYACACSYPDSKLHAENRHISRGESRYNTKTSGGHTFLHFYKRIQAGHGKHVAQQSHSLNAFLILYACAGALSDESTSRPQRASRSAFPLPEHCFLSCFCMHLCVHISGENLKLP